ncbi:MAG: MlaC/ttg2D family ABC transporter substrate-binding protein [Thiogranum sp.]
MNQRFLSAPQANMTTGPGARGALVTRFLALLLVMPWLSGVAVGATERSPQALVEAVSGDVLGALRNPESNITGDREKLVALIEKRVAPYFDFRLMATQVLGHYWRDASEQQRQHFTAAFKQLLTNTYAAVFRRYDNQTVQVHAAEATSSPDRVMVPTSIVTPGQQDIGVDYRLYRRGNKWQVYDVVVDGISLLINYRSEYSRLLQGESLDSLIARIEAKNAAFLKGAP